jgi:hypothetical protein
LGLGITVATFLEVALKPLDLARGIALGFSDSETSSTDSSSIDFFPLFPALPVFSECFGFSIYTSISSSESDKGFTNLNCFLPRF